MCAHSFRLCKGTLGDNSTIPGGKCPGSVCECWSPYLLPWPGERLQCQATARNSKQSFLSGNSNTLPKLFWNEAWKWTTVLSSCQFWSCNYSLFIGEKHCFSQQVPGPRFTKQVSVQFQSCVKTLLKSHWTIPGGREGQGRLFGECWLPYLLLPYLGRNWNVRWLPSKEVWNSLFVPENSNCWPNLFF